MKICAFINYIHHYMGGYWSTEEQLEEQRTEDLRRRIARLESVIAQLATAPSATAAPLAKSAPTTNHSRNRSRPAPWFRDLKIRLEERRKKIETLE